MSLEIVMRAALQRLLLLPPYSMLFWEPSIDILQGLVSRTAPTNRCSGKMPSEPLYPAASPEGQSGQILPAIRTPAGISLASLSDYLSALDIKDLGKGPRPPSSFPAADFKLRATSKFGSRQLHHLFQFSQIKCPIF